MKRRIFAMLVVLTMVFSMAAVASAEEAQTPGLCLDVTQNSTSVVIAVSLEGCEGVTNGRFTVNYDADVLTLAEVEATSGCAMSSVNDETAGTVAFAWIGSELTAEKTGMLTLTLEVTGAMGRSLTYTAASQGIYVDTQEVEVADASVTLTDSCVDVSALEAAVEAAQGLEAEDYTAESFTAVEAALEEAKTVLGDPDATQAEVDAAAEKLNAALTALVATVNTAELEKAVKTAEGLKKDAYTETTFAAVEKALKAAKAVLADEDATQAEVDAAAEALTKAIAALKKVPTTTPSTGDASGIGWWIALLVVSFLAIVIAIILLILSSRKNGKKGAAAVKKGGKFLSMLLVTIMVLTMVPTDAFAATVDGEDQAGPASRTDATLEQIIEENTNLTDTETTQVQGSATELESVDADLKREQSLQQVSYYGESEIVRIIVELEGESLLEQGYTQNQIATYGLRVASAADSMEKRQKEVAEEIARIVAQSGLVPTPRSTEVKYHYTVALNGMAMSVPYGTLPAIRQIQGVKGAYVVSRYDVPEAVEPTYDTNMYATSESFGTAQVWNELGYTGKGMTIAIIDTGLDLDHPSFADAPEGQCLSYSDVENVITELNAYTLYGETSAVPLTADKVYRSGKVPFGFNYVDASLDVTHDYDSQGDHGTHVAGIAAANKLDTTTVVGVAPDAQVLVMKVFGQNGGAYSDDIIAAIEDCILLDVDVINMSLGAQAGFSEDSVLINEVYGRILESDMLLAVAAGNANSAATGNNLGTNLNLTQDPDNGLVNSPATYLAATTVASLENSAMMMPYFTVDGNKLAYVDVTYYNFAALEGTYEYVVVPGLGDVADYEGLNVQGRIALVQRGTIDFTTKQENAYNAGAVALVVYDNVEGDLISMYDGGFLPNVFISRADGEIMLAAAVDGVGVMEIPAYGSETAIPSSVAGLLSDFSCWGVTPDMQLVPDVTAPGGNIYSCYTDGAYGTMSGTSMASPHIAGMSALVLQYLHEQYPGLTGAEYHTIAEALVMCTAVPVYDTGDILYSPRKQGAGAANVYSAIASPVYLTSYQEATGELTPKGSLGDDPARTGTFTFSFEMHNLSDTDQVYMLDGSLLTDQYVEIDGVEFMSETGRDLTGTVSFEILNKEKLDYDADRDGDTDMDDVRYLLEVANGLKTLTVELDVHEDGVINTVDAQVLYLLLLEAYETQNLVTVPANSSVTVNVTVQLSAEDMAYMDAHYANGIYADGFVRAYAQTEGAVDLSLPFVGFYGDWTDSRMFDNGWYYDAAVNDEDPDNDYYYNRYLNVIFATLGDYVSSFGGLGTNPYILEDYDPEHNVLSPNGDMYYDYVPEIYISLMRSAELLDFTWTDDATGEQLFYEWYAYARKSYYWSGYGMCMPAIYTDAECQPFTFLDENGELVVEDLQHLTLTIRGYLDDGDLDAVEVDEEGNPLPNTDWADDVVEVPVVIDLQAPTMDISSINYYTEEGRNYVSFDVEDNYDIAAVVAMTSGGGAYEYIPVTTKTPGVDGEKDTITLDITDYDATFQIVLCDYGCNETYYELSNQYNTGLSEDSFYAFRRFSTIETTETYYTTTQLNGWYSFETADSMLMHTSQANSGEATVYAAEYVDGYIFGAQAGPEDYNTLFVMKAGSWDRIPLGSERALNRTVYEWPGMDGTYFPLKMIALDMTYDYTTGTMYLLANALEHETYFPEGETNILLAVDIATGDVTILGKIFPAGDEPFLALTLACDNDGILYTINYENGQLYTIGKEPVETTDEFGYGTYEATSVDADGKVSYYPAAYTQSMTVDHATNTLYWAGYQGIMGTAYFIEMDKATGELLGLTATENGAEMVGLFKPWHSGGDIIPQAELTGITLSKTELYLNVGQTQNLTVMAQPYNATVGEVTWETSDASVATVSAYGMVEAVGVGACTITARCGSLTAECTVNISAVDGTLFAYSGETWLLMDAGAPEEAAQIVDAMVPEGQVTAAAYLQGYVYAATVEEYFDEDYNPYYKTNLYKLDASTLTGVLVGTFDGKTTALAFNYDDGFMYGLVYSESYDARYNCTITYTLIRLNLSTAQVQEATTLDSIFPYSDKAKQYNTCSGALAIDYEGNFYVNGDDWETYNDNVLVRFNLSENGGLTNVATYAGFSEYDWQGDAMVWSQRNGGILHVSGTMLEWVDVSDMENVVTVSLGAVRSESGWVRALAIPLNSEPELPVVAPTAVYLEESYTVPVGEITRAIPTMDPWNASAEIVYTVADETIATVDENGVITGVAIGETTLTATVSGTDISTTAKIIVEKNPGYLYGFAQADIAQGVPLEYWIKMPVSNPANGTVMTDTYDFTIYAAEFYDGYIYAYAQSQTDGLYYFLRINAGSFNYEVIAQGDILVRDMAFDYTTGTMYLVAYNDVIRGGLFQMDLDTAELTLIGDNSEGVTLVTLACDDEGNLYTADSTGKVYAMDKEDAYLTDTGISGGESRYLQAMTYDWNNDAVYWVMGGTLYRVDVENSQLISLGAADIYSGEMVSYGCVVSGLFSVPLEIPVIPETVAPSGVAMDEKNTVAVGETVTLDAVVLPVSVANVAQTIRWTSGDESIATVDENGVVTGVSAGTVHIFAADDLGHEASTLVTVTEEHRYFYGYDEISKSWVSFDFDGVIVNTWPDAEGLSPIVAAQYIGDTLYAYDADGYFYTVDTQTFERTLLGDGIHGLSVDLEAWDTTHDENVYFVEDVPYQVVDMTYTVDVRGRYVAYAVMMAYNISTWRDSFSYKVAQINLTDGTISKLIVDDQLVDAEMSLRPTNLIYRGGDLYTVNGYITGMVTRIDIEDGSVTGQSIFASYWGDFNGGRSLIEDPLTGEVYAIRDMRTEYIGTEGYNGAYSTSELCRVSLTIARCDSIATVGANVRLTGLFIK